MQTLNWHRGQVVRAACEATDSGEAWQRAIEQGAGGATIRAVLGAVKGCRITKVGREVWLIKNLLQWDEEEQNLMMQCETEDTLPQGEEAHEYAATMTDIDRETWNRKLKKKKKNTAPGENGIRVDHIVAAPDALSGARPLCSSIARPRGPSLGDEDLFYKSYPNRTGCSLGT